MFLSWEGLMSQLETFLVWLVVFMLAIAGSIDGLGWLTAESGQANFYTLGVVVLGGGICALLSVARQPPQREIQALPGEKITKPLP